MIGHFSLLAAVLAVVSVVSLSLISLLCLRCKRKSKIIHEEHQIYNPQTFQREGSMFAVTRSKTVIRANQITSTIIETCEDHSQDAIDDQSDYQNIDAESRSSEHTYVAALPLSVYENEQIQNRKTDDENPAVYGNIHASLSINEDDDDYENQQFLDEMAKKNEDEEPDYVNEDGT